MINSKIVLFLLTLAVWMLLSWSFAPEDLFVGTLLGFVVTWLTCDMFSPKANIFRRFSRYLWFIYYIPLFIWECIKANIDSAYRVIHPDLPMRPGIVKVKTSLKSDTALVILANTLTLKPGTMTVDMDKDNGFLYIHSVDVGTEDVDKASVAIIGKFERVLKRIFE